MADTDPGNDTEAPPFLPMEARLVEVLPSDPGWQFEPKWDGFRCLAIKRGGATKLFAKSGKPLARFFPEVGDNLQRLEAEEFILDGELVIPLGESLSFGALQQRLHPAESRIRKLAAETPALFVAFDLLRTPDGKNLLDIPLSERRAALERLLMQSTARGIRLSPITFDRDIADGWLQKVSGALDGVLAKRLDQPYTPDERSMLKVKKIRSADCVVGGFRYATGKPVVGSLLLGLFDEAGKLNHVGFTSGFDNADRAELTRRLEALKDGPGFTGKSPGGPSRWSTERTSQFESLRHELVVEVLYDQVTDDRFRHGTRLHRWRPDKAPSQCRMDQLEREARPERIIAEVIAGRSEA